MSAKSEMQAKLLDVYAPPTLHDLMENADEPTQDDIDRSEAAAYAMDRLLAEAGNEIFVGGLPEELGGTKRA